MPKISVIMNCYNGERFVKEAIDSVYAQTFKDWEIVFWDNASTDRTPEIARSYDSRLRYFRAERNSPLGRARNLAMEKATGDWIAFVDYDDVSFPSRFERQMAAIGGGDYVLCAAGVRDVDEDGRKLRDVLPQCPSGDILDAQLRHFDLYLQTTMVRSDALKKFNIRINEECRTSEDYNLFMRLAAKGDCCMIPEVLSTCRIVGSSLTDRTLERHAIERFLTLEELKAENPGIDRRCPAGFRQAEARGHYYRANYMIRTGAFQAARSELMTAVGVSPQYFLLYVISFWPALWRLMHDRRVKSRLSQFLLAWQGR